MISFLPLSLLVVAFAKAAMQTSRYFEQSIQQWRPLPIENSSSIELRLNYQQNAIFSVGSDGTLFLGDTLSRNPDAVLTESTGTPLQKILCGERRVLVSYVFEAFVIDGVWGGNGLSHKIILAADDDRDDWPAGLGFTFGSGTLKSLVLWKGYDYGTPTAFAYKHEGNNTCTSPAKNVCTVFQNTTVAGERTYLGNYTVNLEARVDTKTNLMRWHSLKVRLENDTFVGNLFDIANATLDDSAVVNGTRWLSTNAGATRFYFMARRNRCILHNLTIDVVEECADFTTTATPGTASVFLSENKSTTAAVQGADLTTASEAFLVNNTNEIVTAEEEDSTTMIIFIVVASVFCCILVVVLVVFVVRRYRSRKEHGSEFNSSSSDDNNIMPAQNSSVVGREYGNLPVRYVSGKGMVPIQQSEYDIVSAPQPRGFYHNLSAMWTKKPSMATGMSTVAQKPSPIYDRAVPLNDNAEAEMREHAFARDYAFAVDVANISTSSESTSDVAAKRRKPKPNQYDSPVSRLVF
jgi:hypothetical protein